MIQVRLQHRRKVFKVGEYVLLRGEQIVSGRRIFRDYEIQQFQMAGGVEGGQNRLAAQILQKHLLYFFAENPIRDVLSHKFLSNGSKEKSQRRTEEKRKMVQIG